MNHNTHDQILRVVNAIADTQRWHGQLLGYIANSLNNPQDTVKLIELTDQLRASHDRLQAALDA